MGQNFALVGDQATKFSQKAGKLRNPILGTPANLSRRAVPGESNRNGCRDEEEDGGRQFSR